VLHLNVLRDLYVLSVDPVVHLMLLLRQVPESFQLLSLDLVEPGPDAVAEVLQLSGDSSVLDLIRFRILELLPELRVGL